MKLTKALRTELATMRLIDFIEGETARKIQRISSTKIVPEIKRLVSEGDDLFAALLIECWTHCWDYDSRSTDIRMTRFRKLGIEIWGANWRVTLANGDHRFIDSKDALVSAYKYEIERDARELARAEIENRPAQVVASEIKALASSGDADSAAQLLNVWTGYDLHDIKSQHYTKRKARMERAGIERRGGSLWIDGVTYKLAPTNLGVIKLEWLQETAERTEEIARSEAVQAVEAVDGLEVVYSIPGLITHVRRIKE